MISYPAPAKINLYLHIGPLRRDGLHELASLFVFAEDGDLIRVEEAPELSLRVEGPFAGALKELPQEKNLVFKAAQKLRALAGVEKGAAITLEKNLPVAAGVGGGSADAAAALRALVALWRIEIPDGALSELAFSLGADVPACLARRPVLVSGAGERLEAGPILPPMWITLVNPMVEMPTGPIFCAFDAATPEPEAPVQARLRGADYSAVRALMADSRNHLQPFAIDRAPVIAEVIAMLGGAPGALAARMSGSGATSFALFPSEIAARRAALKAQGLGWWALASRLHVR